MNIDITRPEDYLLDGVCDIVHLWYHSKTREYVVITEVRGFPRVTFVSEDQDRIKPKIKLEIGKVYEFSDYEDFFHSFVGVLNSIEKGSLHPYICDTGLNFRYIRPIPEEKLGE